MSDYEFTPFEDLPEKDQLAAYISDIYKDLHGFRPRHYNLNEMSLEEVRGVYESLCKESEEEFEREERYNADSLAKFQRELLEYQEVYGARSEIDAIIWMMDGECFEVDTRYQCWRWDIEQWFRGRGLSDLESEGYAKEFIAARGYNRLAA
jgi:hypothetical protein